METFSVNELAAKVQTVGKSLGLEVEIRSIENPRIEAEEHYYNPVSTGLLELGLKPHYLTDAVLAEMIEPVMRHKAAISEGKIFRKITWS